MFKCEHCKRITKPREKQYKHILKTRTKSYCNVNEYGGEKYTRGREIVKEINICEKCNEKLKN